MCRAEIEPSVTPVPRKRRKPRSTVQPPSPPSTAVQEDGKDTSHSLSDRSDHASRCRVFVAYRRRPPRAGCTAGRAPLNRSRRCSRQRLLRYLRPLNVNATERTASAPHAPHWASALPAVGIDRTGRMSGTTEPGAPTRPSSGSPTFSECGRTRSTAPSPSPIVRRRRAPGPEPDYPCGQLAIPGARPSVAAAVTDRKPRTDRIPFHMLGSLRRLSPKGSECNNYSCTMQL